MPEKPDPIDLFSANEQENIDHIQTKHLELVEAAQAGDLEEVRNCANFIRHEAYTLSARAAKIVSLAYRELDRLTDS